MKFMKATFMLAALLLTSACAVVPPAPGYYYGPGYYEPAPVYYGPSFGFSYYGYYGGGRGHWGGHRR